MNAEEGSDTLRRFPEAGSFQATRSRSGASKRHGLYGQVVDIIGRQIINGELAAGTIIFAEQICEQLDISRSVVREGLRTLSSMGLVESRPQRGTRVQPREHWDLLNPQIVQWRGEGPDYLQQTHELLELRFGIEHAAAHFAALRMSETARTAVVAAGTAMKQAYENRNPYDFFAADAELHQLMLEGAGNAILARFSGTVIASLHIRGRSTSRSYSEAQSLDADSAERHYALARALADRDPETAQRVVAEIMTATLAEIERLLEYRRGRGGSTA